MVLRFSVIFVFVGQLFAMMAQDDQFLGNFPIYNFTNDDFRSPVQIWTGCQTENGVLLFGNDEKIIRFNGKDWSFISSSARDASYTTKQISNKKVYKLFTSSTGIVYCARNESLGILKYDEKGNHTYEAFYIDEQLKSVWSIDELSNGDIIFVNQNNILRYELATETVHFIDVPKLMQLSINQSSAKVSKGLIISATHNSNDSLLKAEGPDAIYFLNYTDFSIQRIFVEGVSKELSFNFRTSVTIAGKDFLVDQNHGLLPIIWEKNRYVIHEKSKGIYKNIDYVVSDALIYEGILWLATEKEGVVLVNSRGEVVREFSMQEGLQDHNVFSFFFDAIGNLWLMLDNGISVIELSSNVVFWDRNQGAPSKVEVITADSTTMYLASRSGLFVSRKKNNRVFYENIESINEATFDVLIAQTDYGKRKLVIGYNGIYELKENEKIDIIRAGLYAWKLHQSPTNPNKIYVGGEGFIGYLEISARGWKYVNLEMLDAEVRFFTSYKNAVYASVQNSGVYIINSVDKITKIPIPENANFKNSHFTLAVFKDKIYAGSTKGMYELQQGSLKLVKPIGLDYDKEFTNIHRLYQEPDGSKMWAIVKIEDNISLSKTEIGYFNENQKGQLEFFNIKNKILERGLVYDIRKVNNLLYFGSDKGPYALNISKFRDRVGSWKVYIDRILVNDTLALKIPELSGEFQPILASSVIRFNYAANAFFNGGDIEYRSRLIGFNDEWSDYEQLNFKIYEKLPYGNYTLEIQGMNQYNQESEVYQFSFEVLPPFYLTWWAYFLYLVALIILLFITTRVSTNRIKLKNKRLEEIVHERTKEIANQNAVLAKQRDEISAKTEDILDSIKYAKRLQNTILPSQEILSSCFHDYFVFYRPKDIVSGDFYWVRKINGKLLWSAIDCTGHGVPGAMVSIVGNNGLMRATNEFQLVKPSEILNKLRDLVIESFKAQGTNNVKDGMDIGLACLDLEQMQLEFAGANNSCVIIREGELIEIKGDKQPIGDFELAKPFTNHLFQLEKGDNIYLFTDGYVDQFGGETETSRQNGGKKLKSKPFKEFLQSISRYDMKIQDKLIVEKFDNWRGDIEAIDDVCVIGVKIV